MPKNRKQSHNTNPFKKAVEETLEVSNCFKPGLQALSKYSQKIELSDTNKCQGSVDID